MCPQQCVLVCQGLQSKRTHFLIVAQQFGYNFTMNPLNALVSASIIGIKSSIACLSGGIKHLICESSDSNFLLPYVSQPTIVAKATPWGASEDAKNYFAINKQNRYRVSNQSFDCQILSRSLVVYIRLAYFQKSGSIVLSPSLNIKISIQNYLT